MNLVQTLVERVENLDILNKIHIVFVDNKYLTFVVVYPLIVAVVKSLEVVNVDILLKVGLNDGAGGGELGAVPGGGAEGDVGGEGAVEAKCVIGKCG